MSPQSPGPCELPVLDNAHVSRLWWHGMFYEPDWASENIFPGSSRKKMRYFWLRILLRVPSHAIASLDFSLLV